VPSLQVNGTNYEINADPSTPLLWLIRDICGLKGTKFGCGIGICGACTVLIGGTPLRSCNLTLSDIGSSAVTTIEGLSGDGALHPLQQAFIEHDGLQCGYCTPGQICSAIGMAAEIRRGVPSAVTADLANTSIELTRDELRERMSGNLCRCGAHNGIIAAIGESFGNQPGLAEAAE